MNMPQNKKTGMIIVLVLFLPVIWLAIKLSMVYVPSEIIWKWLPTMAETIKAPLDLRWADHTWMWIGITGLVYVTGITYYKVTTGKRRIGREHGSAAWSSANELNRRYSHDGAVDKIITKDLRMTLNYRRHNHNLNTLVIGAPGTGKSMGYVMPNLMQSNSSFIITDPKGELLTSMGDMLIQNGYDIKVINLVDMSRSHGYNPFVYIRKSEDVLNLINNLIRNTTPKGAQSNDPFWEKAETALLQALMFYLIEDGREEDKHFGSVLELLECANIDEEQETKSALDMMMESLELTNPTSLAVAQYKIFKQANPKTAMTVLVSCAVRLASFNIPAVRTLLSHDELDITSIGTKKTALFAIISDNDKTFNHIIGMLYTQIISELYYQADHNHKGKLPIPVQFYMDEFANIAVPESFEQVLGTMRSRNISANIILQGLSQLKAMFKGDHDTWETIVTNCDTLLFLGTNELTTCEYFVKLLGKETIDTRTYGLTRGRNGHYTTNMQNTGRELLTVDELSQLDNGHCIVRIRGEKPIMDEKYSLFHHRRLNQTTYGKDKTVMPYQKYQKTPNQFLQENSVHLTEFIDMDRMDDFEIINF